MGWKNRLKWGKSLGKKDGGIKEGVKRNGEWW